MEKPSILVCEDEEHLRNGIRMFLEADYDVRLASSGEEALEQFKAQPADLVLLDIKLPKMNGLDVLEVLMTSTQPPKVLMLTAYQSTEVAKRATQFGALDYVTKPFERTALLKAVQRALGLRVWQRSSPHRHLLEDHPRA